MYLNHFGFRKKPFHITPDPDFLYLSPSHKEALGSILYGINERMGFVAITGEVGTGKTTIIRAFLEQINQDEILPVYIFNAQVSFQELLHNIFSELGLKGESNVISDMVYQLNVTLIEKYKKNQNIVLIIDEAQGMPEETLEQIRILSNLETTKEKLLQIILVGQPELDDKLHKKELRQLRQRIAIRALIKSLSDKESYEYIQHRISKVTNSSNDIFSKNALKLIVKNANGVPRIINTLCDNALIATFGYQEKVVNSKIVKEVVDDYYERETSLDAPNLPFTIKESLPSTFSYKSIASVVFVVLVVAFCLLLGVYLFQSFNANNSSRNNSPESISEKRFDGNSQVRQRKLDSSSSMPRSAVDRHSVSGEKKEVVEEKITDGHVVLPNDEAEDSASDTSLLQVFK